MSMVLADGQFEQFGADHLGAMFVIAVIAGALSIMLRRAGRRSDDNRARRTICWTFALLLVTVATAKQIYEVVVGIWTLEGSLPLHLCDLGVVVTAAALIYARTPHGTAPDAGAQRTPPPTVAVAGARQPGADARARPWWLLPELAYYWGLGGTAQAILTPELPHAFPHPIYFAFFANHGGIIVAVFALVVGLGLRPRRGFPLRVWLITNLFVGPVALVNWLIGANYMYLCGPPEKPSLYDYFGPWPWSVVTLEAVGLFAAGLFYVPFWLRDRYGVGKAAAGESPSRAGFR